MKPIGLRCFLPQKTKEWIGVNLSLRTVHVPASFLISYYVTSTEGKLWDSYLQLRIGSSKMIPLKIHFNTLPVRPTRYTLLGLLTVGMVLGSGLEGWAWRGHRAERLLVLALLSSSSSSSDELPDWTSRLARSTASWMRRENSLSARRQPFTTKTQNGVLCSPYLWKRSTLQVYAGPHEEPPRWVPWAKTPPDLQDTSPGSTHTVSSWGRPRSS